MIILRNLFLLDKAIITQLVKLLLAFYGTRKKGHYRVYKSPLSPRTCVIFRSKLAFYGKEILAHRPTPEASESPLIYRVPQLIQYIGR